MEWSILVPLWVLTFWGGYRFGRKGRNKRLFGSQLDTQFEARLEMAREEIAGQAKIIATMESEIDRMRKFFEAHNKSGALSGIKDLENTIDALRMANRTADHILTASTPAFHGSVVH